MDYSLIPCMAAIILICRDYNVLRLCPQGKSGLYFNVTIYFLYLFYLIDVYSSTKWKQYNFIKLYVCEYDNCR